MNWLWRGADMKRRPRFSRYARPVTLYQWIGFPQPKGDICRANFFVRIPKPTIVTAAANSVRPINP